jgi:hypothetical protein
VFQVIRPVLRQVVLLDYNLITAIFVIVLIHKVSII